MLTATSLLLLLAVLGQNPASSSSAPAASVKPDKPVAVATSKVERSSR